MSLPVFVVTKDYKVAKQDSSPVSDFQQILSLRGSSCGRDAWYGKGNIFIGRTRDKVRSHRSTANLSIWHTLQSLPIFPCCRYGSAETSLWGFVLLKWLVTCFCMSYGSSAQMRPSMCISVGNGLPLDVSVTWQHSVIRHTLFCTMPWHNAQG